MSSPFKKTTGAAGITYLSEAEALMSYKLFALGIVSCDQYYSHPFTDPEGETFHAKSDFRCPYTGIYIESKNGHLNGLKNKQNADNALSNFNISNMRGFVTVKNEAKKILNCSWSASVPKFQLVQNQLAQSGQCVIMVFDKLPKEDTLGRLSRAQVLWCVYGDEHWQAFLQFRFRVRLGVRATYSIKGHLLESYGGGTYIEDFPPARITKRESMQTQ